MATASAVITQFSLPSLFNNFQGGFRELSDEYQNLLTRIWSNGLGELDEIEETYRPTPIQNEVIASGVQQWCNLHISLPSAALKSIDIINYVWYRLSIHHACLRSTFHRDQEHDGVFIRVFRRASTVQTSESDSPASSYTANEDDEGLARLVINFHPTGKSVATLHIQRAFIDNTSLGVIGLEFVLLYCGLPIPDHPSESAFRQHIQARVKHPKKSQKYWGEHLDGLVGKTLLTSIAQSKEVQLSKSQSVTKVVEDVKDLYQFLRDHETKTDAKALFEIVWALLVYHHSGRQNVVFATSGREEDFYRTVGLIDQTYLVRLNMTADTTVDTLLNILKSNHTHGSKHSLIGYRAIEAAANLTNIESFFKYSDTLGCPCFAGIPRNFPLMMFVNHTGTLRFTLHYDCCLSEDFAKILLEQFIGATWSILKMADTNVKIKSIKLNSVDEENRIIANSISTKAEISHTTIVKLFEERVQGQPTTPAVQVESGEIYTFERLNQLANIIARQAQLKPRTFTILCMDRSINLIASLFAILKAGSAYVMLDPAGATDRNQQIVQDCKPEVVLVDKQYASLFEKSVVTEDMIAESQVGAAFVNDRNLNILSHAEDPCYVVYTSGSTGTPKGVVLTHKAATTGVLNFSTNQRKRWLLFFNPVFSAAQRTMIAPLIHGVTLCIVSKEVLMTSLAKVINEMKIDSLGITPSALNILSPPQVASLKQITLVGEAVSPQLLDKWCDAVELRNTFGLSECTQLNFGRRLKSGDNPAVVGRPTDSTSAFVLQPESNEVAPVGVAGELCLSGPQLSVGYLNRPEDTKNRFIPSPFGKGKLFCTGDGARLLYDGSIEIIGRLDFQIKINGQRVEPREIDKAILKQDSITECATVGINFQDRHVLVATITISSEMEWTGLISRIRQNLRSSLPSYMIPAFWYPINEIPKNANGKIDYARIKNHLMTVENEELIRLSRSSNLESDKVTDEVELVIRKVWADALQINILSINRGDSFPNLGGSSLQAITAVAQLRTRGLQVEVQAILGSATLQDIASSSVQISESKEAKPKPFSLLDSHDQGFFRGRDSVQDAFYASPLQVSLIAATLSGSALYTYQRTWDIKHLDITKLKSALKTVFDQNDNLRSTFVQHQKRVIQVVRRDMMFPWQEISQRPSLIGKYSENLTISLGEPFFNISILNQRILVVTMHHALFDYWSHRFLYDDATRIYYGQEVPERPSFSQFARYLQTLDTKEHEDYWQSYLTGAEPTVIDPDQGREVSQISQRLPINLRAKASELGVSTGSIIYTAWALVLANQTGSNDVSFATTISGREVPITDVGKMDGPTMTIVPQRILLGFNEVTLLSIAKSIQEGFYKLLKYSQHGMKQALRDGSLDANYIDTMVNVLIKDKNSEDTGEIFKSYGPRPIWRSEYTTLELEDTTSELSVRLSTCMSRKRAGYVLESFVLALKAILSDPYSTRESLDLVSSQEREHLLSNQRFKAPPSEYLHTRFETIAAEHPHVVAIDWDSTREVTYAELNSLANRISSYLQAHGVSRGDVVPMMLDKSVDMIASLIAILKAGAAFLPLDPQNPIDRNIFIIEEAQARHVFAHKLHEDFSKHHKTETLYYEDINLDETLEAPPLDQRTTDDLAYIIYTSGSTGKPKGVMLPHRAAAAAVGSMIEAEGRKAGSWRSLQFANYVFDASVQDIFNTLSSGGTLCIAPTEKLLSDLPGVINQLKAKQAIITPTVAKLVKPDEVPTMEKVIIGGEPMKPDVIEAWCPGREVLNVYGPTETSMVATSKQVKVDGNPKNIGRPLETVFVVLLHPEEPRLVPYGAVGELCIGGPQLSKGYVRRNDKTEKAFIDGREFGFDTIYRSGDYARWLDNDELECLGRKDKQIKVHGHRIELGEVESAIQKTNTVNDNVVLSTDRGDKSYLSAFIEIESSESSGIKKPKSNEQEVSSLANGLSTLTPYMIPKTVIPTGKLPKLASGKVDRKTLQKWLDNMDAKRLAEYSSKGSKATHEFVPTSTPEEKALEEIWAELFEIERGSIGAKASFFSLGGDSITAINLVSLCRRAGFKINVSQVLAAATLDELASQMKRVSNRNTDAEDRIYEPSFEVLGAIAASGLDIRNDVDYTYPAPPGQIEFLNRGREAKQLWTLLTIRSLAKSTDIEKWREASEALTTFNDILRTTWFRVSDEEWIGVVLKKASISIQTYDYANDKQRSRIVEEIWSQRFESGRPFIRYALLYGPDQKREIVIKMDHGVYDGTLFRIFDDQFSLIQRGEPIPDHPVFKEFTNHIWRSDKTDSESFWKDSLRGCDFQYLETTNPVITESVMKMTETNLDIYASACKVTPSVIFQSAFQLWLARLTTCRDVCFDYLLSGRNVELPNPQLINGTLANFLPFRSQLTEDISIKDYLKATQDFFWAATEHGNVGLDSIYRAAERSRAEYGNRVLFLFQPFEPESGPPKKEMRWIVMAQSEVRMYQPYGLVIEISKAVKGHKVKVMYDATLFGQKDAKRFAAEIVNLVDEIVRDREDESTSLACFLEDKNKNQAHD